MKNTLALALLASAAAIAPAPLQAQDAEVEADRQDADQNVIVVTATRREGDLQDAPLAVTAFGDQVLQERSIASVEDVGAIAPGVQIARYQGDTSIFIRGIGTPTIIAGNDSSTAAYLNGTFLSRAAAIGPAFFRCGADRSPARSTGHPLWAQCHRRCGQYREPTPKRHAGGGRAIDGR